jgi:hypothetical protein
MPLDLPGPIAEYFTAEKARDALALAQCFVDDGVVRDEGGTFSGSTPFGIGVLRPGRSTSIRWNR